MWTVSQIRLLAPIDLQSLSSARSASSAVDLDIRPRRAAEGHRNRLRSNVEITSPRSLGVAGKCDGHGHDLVFSQDCQLNDVSRFLAFDDSQEFGRRSHWLVVDRHNHIGARTINKRDRTPANVFRTAQSCPLRRSP